MSDFDAALTAEPVTVPDSPGSPGTTPMRRLGLLAVRLASLGFIDDANDLVRIIEQLAAPQRELDVIATNTQRALDAEGGHVVRAARRLGVSPKALYNRINAASGGDVSRRFADYVFDR